MKQEARWKTELLPMLPAKLSNLLYHVDDSFPLEELRIRAGQPLEMCGGGMDRLLSPIGKRPAATLVDCAEIFERICGHSVYAWEDEIKNGFITLAGGYRAGISGHIVRAADGRVESITDITSINLRIARAVVGAADALLPRILRPDGTPYATLLLSAPGIGKTTMLRDIIRQLSGGLNGATAQRICVVDERMELSGSVRGVAQFDLGPRSDVLSGCGKPEGIRLAVRSLSPQVIATDELGTDADSDAVQEASFCGVFMVATAHVSGICALEKRHVLHKLLLSGAIERIVELKRIQNQAGCIAGVWDGSLEPVPAVQGRDVLCFERSQC